MRLLTAFVIGFVILTLEIAYTRVVSFKLFYYYTYFVIGLALLGLGAASAVSLSTGSASLDPIRLVQLVARPAALLGLLGYVVVNRIPTDTNLIWAGTSAQATGQVARLIVLSLSLTAVFFAVGLLNGVVVRGRGGQRPTALLLGPHRRRSGLSRRRAAPGFGRSAGDDPGVDGRAGRAGVVAAAITRDRMRDRRDPHRRRHRGARLRPAEGAHRPNQDVRDRDNVAGGDWGAVFHVDAVEGFGDLYLLHHDGLLGSAIWRYDGTPATTDRFLTDSRQIPFAAAGGAPRGC